MCLYKNIVLFYSGGWQADCVHNGKRFALHRCCCRTKSDAYNVAKDEIDYLNERERNNGLRKVYARSANDRRRRN